MYVYMYVYDVLPSIHMLVVSLPSLHPVRQTWSYREKGVDSGQLLKEKEIAS